MGFHILTLLKSAGPTSLLKADILGLEKLSEND